MRDISMLTEDVSYADQMSTQQLSKPKTSVRQENETEQKKHWYCSIWKGNLFTANQVFPWQSQFCSPDLSSKQHEWCEEETTLYKLSQHLICTRFQWNGMIN